MSALRTTVVWLVVLAAIVSGLLSITFIKGFTHSAEDFSAHHEVTVPLCIFLFWALVSIALIWIAAGVAEKGLNIAVLRNAWLLFVPALLALGASLIFQNEVYYSVFDPKGFPVHPTETFIFPEGGWHGMTSHLLASLLVFIGFGGSWLVLRKKRKPV